MVIQTLRANPLFAFASDQGRRPYMEDYATHMRTPQGHLELWAVFDGHGGDKIAQLCSTQVGRIVLEEYDVTLKPEVYMHNVFQRLDGIVPLDVQSSGMGTTATLILVDYHQQRIICGNAGDTEAFFANSNKGFMLTQNHKVENEVERLQKDGALVTRFPGDCMRVGGALNLGRSIGDKYLAPYVVWKPFVTYMDMAEDVGDLKMMLVASDGLWDAWNMEDLLKAFHGRFPDILSITKEDLTLFLEGIVYQARRKGSSDNIAAFIILL